MYCNVRVVRVRVRVQRCRAKLVFNRLEKNNTSLTLNTIFLAWILRIKMTASAAHRILTANAASDRHARRFVSAAHLPASRVDLSARRKPRVLTWKVPVAPGTVVKNGHGWQRLALVAASNVNGSFESDHMTENSVSSEDAAWTEASATAGESLPVTEDTKNYDFDEAGVDEYQGDNRDVFTAPDHDPKSFPHTRMLRPKPHSSPSQPVKQLPAWSSFSVGGSSDGHALVGFFGLALAGVAYFLSRKRISPGVSSRAFGKQNPVSGHGDLDNAFTDDNTPLGDKVALTGMPTFAAPKDGISAVVAAAPRQISGEFKRMLREMMGDLRRYSTVDLHGRNLGDEGAAYISEALAFNDTATCVDFGANGIGEVGIVAICEALKSNNSLEMLSLASNNLGDSATIVLADYLTRNTTITTLNLSSSGIGDDGASALAEMLKINTTLIAIELNNNSIDYDGTCSLAEALVENSTLETLSISGNYVGGLGARALANGLKKNSGVKGLFLNGNDIGNLGIQPLCRALSTRNAKLTNLDVGNNGIGFDAGKYIAYYIKQDNDLTHLNLYMNELCDLGAIDIASALKVNGAIEVLDIGGNNILDPGAGALAEAMKENKPLRILELGYNPIGAKGAQAIAETLKFHSEINTLRMGWCKITKDGAWFLADAIKYNEHISTLDLRGNELGDEGCAALAHSLQVVNENLISLDLGYNEIKDNGAFALAQAIKNNATGALQSISLNNNYITKLGEVALTEAVELVQELNEDRDLYIQF